MINRKSKRVISGLLAAVTFLSALIQPAAAIAGEPEPAAYEAEYPALETVRPDLAEDEIVTAEDYEMEAGSYFDVENDFIGLEIPAEKVTVKWESFNYMEIEIIIAKETIKVPELESMIEKKLIEQLVYGDSQWVYREDLKTENDLWANFKYILEKNNKDKLNGESLTESEFEQVKNQLQFSSFYRAGEWLAGENGKVQVHVQRDTERLHLVVMNHEHIAGGSSVYEVINQYSALKMDEDSKAPARDRQVIVTTIQKLQRLITKRIQEGTSEYQKIRNLKIAFVVDECHRAVTPGMKRELERFFGNSVLDVILNRSYHKLGFQNGRGMTYEGLLTTSSIQLAQKYYELLAKVKNGETSLLIAEKIKQVLPDFPKFAITYSVSENEEGSQVNQQKMQASLDDYNEMFGTKYELSQKCSHFSYVAGGIK